MKYVSREELTPELREKFQFDALYRCQMSILLGARITLYTSTIPAAWKLNRPIDQYGRARAMFVKILAPAFFARARDPLHARQPRRRPGERG